MVCAAVGVQDTLRTLLVVKSFQVKKGWRTACEAWKPPTRKDSQSDIRFLHASRPAQPSERPSCALCSNQFVLSPPATADSCDIVVATANFGAQDEIREPAGSLPAGSLELQVCYYAFIDTVTRGQFSIIPGTSWHGWITIEVSGFPFSDPRMNGKIPKLLLFSYFKSPRFFVWVDRYFPCQPTICPCIVSGLVRNAWMITSPWLVS